MAEGAHVTAGTAEEAFAAWFAGEQPRVLTALLAAGADREQAREATAEAFARAFERWDRVSAMASPGGWVCRVALNVHRRQMRRAGIEQRILLRRRERPDVAVPEMEPELWAAVRSLPDRQRLAVGLRYLAGYSEAEVAEAMGVAVGTASATLATARRRLAELIGGNHG